MDYHELNKADMRDHFSLPFIDKVLDVLARKKLFSFLDGLIGYNQIQINSEDKDISTFTFPRRFFSYKILPFAYAIPWPHFKE